MARSQVRLALAAHCFALVRSAGVACPVMQIFTLGFLLCANVHFFTELSEKVLYLESNAFVLEVMVKRPKKIRRLKQRINLLLEIEKRLSTVFIDNFRRMMKGFF